MTTLRWIALGVVLTGVVGWIVWLYRQDRRRERARVRDVLSPALVADIAAERAAALRRRAHFTEALQQAEREQGK